MDTIKNMDLWLEEKYSDGFSMKYRIEETLYSKKSDFQFIQVVKTQDYGRMLLNDGLVMVTERDEFSYHDMISHVPMFTHPNPKSVLIIGGGDGGTAREVLRHKSVEECTLVEIDPLVIEAAKEHLPTMSCSFKDSRMKILVQDGVKFARETKEKFDVVIVDSTEPFGPATPLFDKAFYADLSRILNDDGIVVSQGNTPFYDPEAQVSLAKIIRETFPLLCAYNYSNLTYPGGLWTFFLGSKSRHPVSDFDVNRVKSSGLSFEYYNPMIHQGAFALPEFMNQNLGELLDNESK